MSERELIEPHKGDKRHVRRDAHGHFTDEVDQPQPGSSQNLVQDRFGDW